MRRVIIENTDLWTIESHGNGLAYSFFRKSDGKEAFLQGDDAAQWREEYDAISELWANNNGAIPGCLIWDHCLSDLCADYLESE